MITRIELTNFMSHERTVIEPAPGLTVLVGPNNCGKSAIVAALQILCSNADSTYVTRHGAKECSVRVETEDGHLIEWRRKASPCYWINGEKFDRLGRNNVPEQLLKVLRLPRVEIGEDQLFDVHFGEQKSPIFLLDRPASHAAKFFASSSDVDRFLKMQDLHRTKVADAKAQKQRLELESIAVNHELELLEPLVDLDTCLADAEKEHRALDLLAKSIDCLSIDSQELQRQATAVDCAAARRGSFAGLSSPPVLEPTGPLESMLAEITQVEAQLAFIAAQTDVIRELTAPPALAPTEAPTLLVNQLERATRELAYKHDRQTALATVAQPPQLEDSEALLQLGNDLRTAGRVVERRNEEINELALLSAPPQLGDDVGLTATLGQLIEAARGHAHSCQTSDLLFEVQSPPVVVDLAAMEQIFTLLQQTSAQMVECARAKGLLSTLVPVPAPADTAALTDLVDRLIAAAQSEAAIATFAAQVQREFVQTKEKLLSWARAHGICPTCGGAIDAERLVAHLSCAGGATHV